MTKKTKKQNCLLHIFSNGLLKDKSVGTNINKEIISDQVQQFCRICWKPASLHTLGLGIYSFLLLIPLLVFVYKVGRGGWSGVRDGKTSTEKHSIYPSFCSNLSSKPQKRFWFDIFLKSFRIQTCKNIKYCLWSSKLMKQHPNLSGKPEYEFCFCKLINISEEYKYFNRHETLHWFQMK